MFVPRVLLQPCWIDDILRNFPFAKHCCSPNLHGDRHLDFNGVDVGVIAWDILWYLFSNGFTR